MSEDRQRITEHMLVRLQLPLSLQSCIFIRRRGHWKAYVSTPSHIKSGMSPARNGSWKEMNGEQGTGRNTQRHHVNEEQEYSAPPVSSNGGWRAWMRVLGGFFLVTSSLSVPS